MRLLILITVFLSGCATVQSTYQSNADLISGNPNNGLLYFLPKRQLTVTAKQTPVTASTITKAKNKLDNSIKKLNIFKDATLKARENFINTQAAFAAIPGGTPTKLAEMVAEREALLRVKEAAQAKAENNRDLFAAALAEIKAANSAGHPLYTIKVQLGLPEPDLKHAYRANFFHNTIRDDEFSLKVNERGLLTSSNVTSTDQTGQVLIEIAKGVASFGTKIPQLNTSPQVSNFYPSIDPALGGAVATVEIPKISTCEYPIDQPYQFQKTFDPTDNAILTKINLELGACFPYQLEISENFKTTKPSVVGKVSTKINGLVYRAALPHVILVKQCPTDFAALGNVNRRGFVACSPDLHIDDLFMQVNKEITVATFIGVWDTETKNLVNNFNSWRAAKSRGAIRGSHIQKIRDSAKILHSTPLPTVASKRKSAVFILNAVNKLIRHIDPIAQRGIIAERVIKELEESKRKFTKMGKNRPNNKIITATCSNPSTDTLCNWFNTTNELILSLNSWVEIANGKITPALPIMGKIRKIISLNYPLNENEKSTAQDVFRISKSLRETVYVKQTESRELLSAQSTIAMLPNVGPASIIPMKSSAFVKTVHDVTFNNGIVVQWDKKSPSEVLEIVRLPVKILTTILEAPAQIFQLRLNLSNNQNSLVASQQQQIKAQLELNQIEACVERIRLGQSEIIDCIPEDEE